MPHVHRVFYVSRARVDPCGPEPRRILEVATGRNARLGVTGLLFFSGDHFAQVLEGPRAALEEVMDSIRRDPRHEMLLEWPVTPAGGERWFPSWAMAYLFDERLEALIERLGRLGEPLPALEATAGELLAAADLSRLGLFRAGDKA
ncbi:BLUF domain-containing protein [Caldimonas tepidiphila]|uniref:BLUF domain-containing protein n=1 Tax=Caldimonas tepidiphila TaxID=2315841 RepID=UPI00196B2DCC|nr:BLUF domain-containing protein [Caldimonas tepidiphila]